MNEKFIAERITNLRLKKNVSEHRMSLELGQSKSYIQSITSGKALPSIKQLYNICDYFEITPEEFFAGESEDVFKLHRVSELARRLSGEDIELILELMERLSK